MRVILTAVEQSLAEAFERHCGHRSEVEVHLGSIFDVPCDAVVSPANSFGFMDGGIDELYSKRFGRQVQERLQQAIRDHHDGELLVGAAELVSTGDAEIPYLIAAPTMRVPMVLRESVNPYLAARAALLLVMKGVFRGGEQEGKSIAEQVDAVAFPGLGTGVGGVGPNTCAFQVAAALDACLGPAPEFPRTWSEAQTRHQHLYTDRPRDLQRD
jgi:O-acetyl-ADP-ribose deacetylase (regulator of RNase III)